MHFPHPLEIRAKRRRIICVCVVLGVTGGMLGWLVWRAGAEPDEPRYHGHTLTWWLGQYTSPFRDARSLQEIQSFDFESMFRETLRR